MPKAYLLFKMERFTYIQVNSQKHWKTCETLSRQIHRTNTYLHENSYVKDTMFTITLLASE